MADVKIIGAVAVKVRPDTSGFRAATRDKILDQLRNFEVDAKVKVDIDDKDLDKQVDQARKRTEKKMRLTWHADYDSVNKVVNQVEQKLKELSARTVDIKINKKSLDEAQERFEALRSRAKVKMEIAPDERGYKEVLAKIEEIRRSKIMKTVSFATDTDSLNKMAGEYESKIAELTRNRGISIDILPDRKGFQSAIDLIDSELAKFNQRKFQVEIDEQSLTAERARLEQALAAEPYELKVDWGSKDSLETARKELQGQLSKLKAVSLQVDPDEKSIEDALRQIEDAIEEAEKKDVKINTTAHTSAAAAQLKYTTRPRFADIFVRVNKRSVALAEGILQSLAGFNTLRSLGRGLENVALNFDKIAIKTGGFTAAMAGIADTLSFVLTSMLSVGEGVFQSIGLLATAPAAMAALTAGVVITTAAFQDFKNAIDGDAEALAALPPNARAAAEALQGTWEMIQQPVQDAFWSGMGDELGELVDVIIPQFRDGLAQSSDDAGRFVGEVARSMKELALSDGLGVMFDNLEGMFENAAGAAAPFVEAINTLGLRGSEYLPHFGAWLARISDQFNNWVQEADKNGEINQWIEDGVESLKDMWGVAGSTIDIFKALTRAANRAGMQGLSVFNDNLRDTADMMLDEPFQSRMATIFKGANEGARELNEGVKDLGSAIGESADFTGELLTKLGKLGGGILSGIASAFSEIQFQDGIMDAVDGLNSALGILGPSFEGIGRIVGRFGSIAGDVFRNIAPVVNNVIRTLDQGMQRLGPALERLSGPLTGILDSTVRLLSGPVLAAVEALSIMIDAFSAAPPVIQSVVTALAGFTALRIGGFFTSFQQGMGRVRDAVIKTNPILTTWQAHSARQVALFNKNMGGVKTGPFATQMTAMTKIAQRGTRGISRAFGGVMSLMGGGWGIALMAGIGAVSAFGRSHAEAAGRVDELRNALDSETGAITDNAIHLAMEQLDRDMDLFEPGGAGNIIAGWFGQGLPSVSESLGDLGLNLEDVTRAAMEGGPAFDELMAKLKILAGASGSPAAAEAAQQLADKLGLSDEVAHSFATGGGALVIKRLQELRGDTDASKASWTDWNGAAEEAGGVAEVVDPRMESLGRSMQILADETAGANEKVQALKDALAILNGEAPSTDEALHRIGETIRDLGDFFKDAEGNSIDMSGLIDVKSGEIAVTEFGTMLRNKIEELNDESFDVAVRMDAEGADGTEIFAYLEGVRRKFIEAGKTAGLKAGEINAAWDRIANGSNMDAVFALSLDITDFQSDAQLGEEQLARMNLMRAVATLAGDNKPLGVELALSYGDLNAWDSAVGIATADLNGKAAQAEKNRLMGELINFAAQHPTAAADIDPRLFNREEQRLIAELAWLDRQQSSPSVDAATAAAQQKLGAVQRLLNSIDGRRASSSVTVVYKTDKSGWAPPTGAHVPDGAVYADGGHMRNNRKVKQFADGGALQSIGAMPKAAPVPQRSRLRGVPRGFERHVAQIARPGVMPRVWAEKETKGETYIPHAASKRTQSVKILGQTASMFGYDLINRRTGEAVNGTAGTLRGRSAGGARQYADGGIEGDFESTLGTSGGINLTINGVPMDYAQETADTIMAALRHAQRGGAYTGVGV